MQIQRVKTSGLSSKLECSSFGNPHFGCDCSLHVLVRLLWSSEVTSRVLLRFCYLWSQFCYAQVFCVCVAGNGTFMNHTGADACYVCPEGYSCVNRDRADPCRQGYYCPEGRIVHIDSDQVFSLSLFSCVEKLNCEAALEWSKQHFV